MKTYLLALLFLALLAPLQADTASHRQAAEDMLNLVNGPEAFQAGFEAILPTLTASLKQNGVPDAQIKQVETAFREWIKREIKWDELRPKMVDTYVREFTEPELKELIAFYKTPTGSKSLKKMPILLAEGTKIGEEYAASKSASLDAALDKILGRAP